MKIPEKAKKLWARLPRLPRRWRIVRNLAAAAALGVLAVYLLGWPCLSQYGAFQRLEGVCSEHSKGRARRPDGK